jgi:hypothetical protein
MIRLVLFDILIVSSLHLDHLVIALASPYPQQYGI